MEQSSDAMAQYEKDLYKKALLEWRQSLIVTGEKSQTEYDRATRYALWRRTGYLVRFR